MQYKKILVISDNPDLINKFMKIIKKNIFENAIFSFRCSFGNILNTNDLLKSMGILPLNLKVQTQEIAREYDLILSLHCKQIFPNSIIEQVKCINVHPGYIPFNRGWFPQVFSIINKKPFGVTIHEIDNQLDHGPIITQRIIPIYDWDSSLSVYERAVKEEMNLLEQNLPAILDGNYTSSPITEEGNLNYKKDYEKLCQLDMTNIGTLKEHIDLLRALSHGEYKNAFFISESCRKVFVNIKLDLDD